MTNEAEERLRRALGDAGLRTLRFHASKILGMDMMEALERDPEAVREALKGLLGSDYAVKFMFRIMGLNHAGNPHPPTRGEGGRGWEA